jgi:Nuclease-related domain
LGVRVVRNIGYVRKRKRIARIMVAIGLLLVASSFASIFFPRFLIFAYVGLGIGFLTFNNGLQQLTRWGRKPRNDEILDTTLARLNDRYTLIHYPDFPGRRPDHLLVTPSGVIVMTAREIGGRLRVTGRKWRKMGSPLGFFFGLGGPQLGNPTFENEQQIETVKELATQIEPDVPVDGAIVFLHPDVEIEVFEETVPVVHATELLDFVRDKATTVTLGTRERDALVAEMSRGEDLERAGATGGAPKKKVRAA